MRTKPRQITIVSSSARTATGNSGSIEIPLADSYSFTLICAAGTGTSPTLDVAIQRSYDGGTTWISGLRHAQVTTAAVNHSIEVSPHKGRGEAGSAVTFADTGGALNANQVIPKDIRVLWTIGGTNPSFTFSEVLFANAERNQG